MGRRYVDIIYEDHDLIVVNKPRGVVVVSERTNAPTRQRANALADSVRAYLLRKYPGARGAYVKPLHRLDKETTGLVIFAKSRAGEGLIDAIKSHRVVRKYVAVVEGAVEKESGTINLPIEKGDFGYGKRVGLAGAGEGGMKAVTHYRVVERYENATLLQVWLETGRTHQIRLHLSAVGHPLVGDKVYNPHGRIAFPRQALHAAELSLKHPVSGKKIEVSAKTPRDISGLIDTLRGS